MKADDPLPARIVRQLQPLGPVYARAMFGGCGIFLDDLMFALIDGERLYLKVDDATKPRFAAAGGRPFVYQGKHKPVEMSYWTLPDERLADPDTPDALADWASLGLRAARQARTAKTRGR